MNEIIKVGILIWTIDPDGRTRIFLRHNRPFNGFPDEWNFPYGHVEKSDSHFNTVLREMAEEVNIVGTAKDVTDLNYSISKIINKKKVSIYFYALHVVNINVKITLNEESIGYDWVPIMDAKKMIKYIEEKKAVDVLLSKIPICT